MESFENVSNELSCFTFVLFESLHFLVYHYFPLFPRTAQTHNMEILQRWMVYLEIEFVFGHN